VALTHHADRAAAIDSLRQVGEHVRPVALAGERTLPVAAPLAGLFPDGGLRRGSSLSVDGVAGVTSLALAVVGGGGGEGGGGGGGGGGEGGGGGGGGGGWGG
jgi:hypothetical protein